MHDKTDFLIIIILNEHLMFLVHENNNEWGGKVTDISVRRFLLKLVAATATPIHTESHIGKEISRYETHYNIDLYHAQMIAKIVDPSYCAL